MTEHSNQISALEIQPEDFTRMMHKEMGWMKGVLWKLDPKVPTCLLGVSETDSEKNGIRAINN